MVYLFPILYNFCPEWEVKNKTFPISGKHLNLLTEGWNPWFILSLTTPSRTPLAPFNWNYSNNM